MLYYAAYKSFRQQEEGKQETGPVVWNVALRLSFVSCTAVQTIQWAAVSFLNRGYGRDMVCQVRPNLIQGVKIMNNKAVCPECEAEVTIPAGAMLSELISCKECGAELEIISLNPPQVDLAPETEEDWGE